MPSSYTSSLRLTLPATGELSGQWGSVVNQGITELLDAAVAGTASISTWGGAGVAYTLSNNSGTADEARKMFIVATGSPGEAKNVICPAVSKFYVFRNDTTGGFALTLKTSGGTGIAVPAGQYKFLYCDGTNVVEMFNSAGALTLSGALSVGGTATFAANPTLSAGTANQVQYLNGSKVLSGSANLTFDGTTLTANTATLTNALAASSGGTGQSTYTAGDLIYATGATALAKLGIGASTTVLTSSGTAPQWTAASSVAIGTATNLAGGAAGSVPYQSGAATTTFLSIGAANTVMTSSGAAPQWSTALTGLTGVSTTTLSASSTVSGAGFSTYLASPPAIGGTAPAAGSFTTLSASSTVSGTGFSTYLASPPAIGGTAPAAGSFTTLSASSTVSGTGFSTYLASPPAIGGTAANTGAFTTLSASSSVTLSGGTDNGVLYLNGSKVATSGTDLVFSGTNGFITSGGGAFQGATAPSSGAGIELSYGALAGIGRILGYNRTGATRVPIVIDGSYVAGYADGTEGMRLTSTGLGIGVTPTRKLDLYGTSTLCGITSTGASGYSQIDFVANARAYQIGVGGGSTGSPYANNLYFVDSTASAVRMVLDSSGNLGIGTSSPGYKLDVVGVGKASSAFAIGDSSGNLSGTFTNESDVSKSVTFNADPANVGASSFMRWNVDGSERMRLDSSGNLGLGVTPSAWNSGYRVLEFGAGAALWAETGSNSNIWLSSNTTLNSGGSFIYKTTAAAAAYNSQTGIHRWYTAPSGTAGTAISFGDPKMTLDASGNLVVGSTTAAGKLNAVGITYLGSDSNNALYIDSTSTLVTIGAAGRASFSTSALRFLTSDGTAALERARITSGGDFRIKGAGTAGSTDAVQFSGSAPASSFIYDSNGYLGIGTTPSYILHIAGGTSSANRQVRFENNSSTASHPELMVLSRTSTSSMPTQVIGGYYISRALTDATEQTAAYIQATGSNVAGSSVSNMTLYALTQHIFQNSSGERARLTDAGNFKIGNTTNRATTEGTNQLVLFNGTAPAGTLTNGVSIYSSSGEAYVMDAAGNATLFSPHDAETNEWIFKSKHTPTGRVLRIDVEKLLRFVNDHFGLDAVQEFIE